MSFTFGIFGASFFFTSATLRCIFSSRVRESTPFSPVDPSWSDTLAFFSSSTGAISSTCCKHDARASAERGSPRIYCRIKDSEDSLSQREDFRENRLGGGPFSCFCRAGHRILRPCSARELQLAFNTERCKGAPAPFPFCLGHQGSGLRDTHAAIRQQSGG